MIRLLVILGIFATLMGCSGRTGVDPHIASVQSRDVLRSEFVTSVSGDVVSIGFKMTAVSDFPITLSFPTSPVNFYYEIHDDSGRLIKTYQDGVLSSIETITLAPGDSLSRHSFTLKKSSVLDYQISNTIRYYMDGVLHTDVIHSII